MNSIRTTYLPRAIPDRLNLPSEFVADKYFFPVNVFAAVTVTPGSGVFPLCADPVISNVAAAGVAVTCGVGAGGAASCARELGENRSAAQLRIKMPRVMDFNSRAP
jgi:hypothetical protein